METATTEPTATTTEPTAPAPELSMWNRKAGKFPRNRYILRMKEVTGKLSKAGNPMLEFQWEIVGEKKSVAIKVDGVIKQFGIIGLTVPNWMSLSDASKDFQRDTHKLLGLGAITPNPVTPDLTIYNGLIVNAIVGCEPTEELSDEVDVITGKQIPILDDEGKPIINYRLVMSDIISRNTTFVPAIV